jgi:hypothetical protein
MSDLIKALQILLKYGDPKHPTNCSHVELAICGIDPTTVSNEDQARLAALGFSIVDDEYFSSFRFGNY